MSQKLRDHLAFIYGEEQADSLAGRLLARLDAFRNQIQGGAPGAERVSEQDAILITYGDMVQTEGERPLHTLADFLRGTVADVISTVHILPFYPYSSDDGFSVIDYKAVDPNLGDWEDVARFRSHFRLMFDAVVNHISAHSDWFQNFIEDDLQYRHYFIALDPDTDLSQVFRPRTSPLLTPVETAVGPKHVWTTFSDDQIDLNFSHPDVLLDVIETLLFYVLQGASFIRLDAIAFIWKEIGTDCIHRPQTHEIVRLMRSVLDEVAPHVSLITETNVPHKDNISYFGDGRDEAQMVYNFSLPPLTLHAFHTGQAQDLSRWADSLSLPSDEVTFFNFLASHDGIGVTPARGLLDDDEIEAMAARVKSLGGHVSYKNNPDGSQTAYELNINYLDALGDPLLEETPGQQARRFLAAQAIMLALQGVPGIYFHSLFGSRSWHEGVKETGRYRTINRQKLARRELAQALADPDSLRARVFRGTKRLLQLRRNEPAFHPTAPQTVLFCHPAVFALLRTGHDGRSQLLCLHNVSGQKQRVRVFLADQIIINPYRLHDLLREKTIVPHADDGIILEMAPYQISWLKVMASD